MPPPPPKPGVIPLAPLAVGDILGGAFSTLGRYWKQLLGIGASAYGATLAVVAVAALIAYSSIDDHLSRLFELSADEDPARADLVPVLSGLGIVWLIGMIMFVLATALVYAAVPVVLQEAVLGRPTTLSAVWRRAWPRVPALLGTVLLMALVVMVPVLLLTVGLFALVIGVMATSDSSSAPLWVMLGFLGVLATLPLGTWLWVKFSLAPAVVIFEEQRPIAALRRSSQLVRGDWWRVFGIGLLGTAIAGVASYMIQIPFSFLGMFSGALGSATLPADPNPASLALALSGYVLILGMGQMVGQLISATFPQLVTGLLYVDRRMRTEGLGPALAEAAAVPFPQGPYEPQGPQGL